MNHSTWEVIFLKSRFLIFWLLILDLAWLKTQEDWSLLIGPGGIENFDHFDLLEKTIFKVLLKNLNNMRYKYEIYTKHVVLISLKKRSYDLDINLNRDLFAYKSTQKL